MRGYRADSRDVPKKSVMDDHTRTALKCDTCRKKFEERETIFRAKDGTLHCVQCGWWCRGEPEVNLSPARFKGTPRRERPFN